MSKWHRLSSGCVRILMRNLLQLQHTYTMSRTSGLFNKLGGVKESKYSVQEGRKEGSLAGLAIIEGTPSIHQAVASWY
jgi:hypothetical protein